VGDVCGKGVPAAKHMALVRHTLRAMAADDLPANAWLAEAHRRLTAVDGLSDFVTVALVVLDLENHVLEYSLAGHPPPYLACEDGLCVLDSVVGLPLGAAEEAAFDIARMPFRPGDVLLLYTDGLSEARCDGRQFGFDSLEAEARTMRGRPFQGEARRLVESARAFSQGELHDDTVVVLLRLKPA
jgi:serine phosphatase RsbU (regulator of sigma subunit)